MEHDKLNKLWESQGSDPEMSGPRHIIKSANKQRRSQYIGIAVMSLTVLILIIYALFYATTPWSNFNLGLLLMISSLAIRIVIELLSMYRKEYKLISLDIRSFQQYLKKHYQLRLRVNYIITPICFAVYIFGFGLILPFLKKALSSGFYTYVLISGVVSLVIIAFIILNSIRKEHHFLKELNRNT